MQRNIQRLSRVGLFGGPVNRSTSTKILGSDATPIHMQKRNCYPGYRSNVPTAISLGVLSSPFFATYLIYKSYFHKADVRNTNLNESNVPEQCQSTRRPGKM
jgi:hypothetical protein